MDLAVNCTLLVLLLGLATSRPVNSQTYKYNVQYLFYRYIVIDSIGIAGWSRRKVTTSTFGHKEFGADVNRWTVNTT